jgi:hypothetical protein
VRSIRCRRRQIDAESTRQSFLFLDFGEELFDEIVAVDFR